MEFAADPRTGEGIDVAEYIRRYGQRGAGADMRPQPHCEVCRQAVRPRGELTPNTHAHFAHLRGSDRCPTQDKTGEPYLRLTPTDPDPERAAWLRQEVHVMGKRVIEWLYKAVPLLAPPELDSMLASAARVRLWEHRHLQPWQVPLCLLMMQDFGPATGLRELGTGELRRQRYFRFWFATRTRSLEELWITKPTRVEVWRGTYVQRPGGQRPGAEEFTRSMHHLVTPELDWPGADRRPGERLMTWFCDVLNKHLP